MKNSFVVKFIYKFLKIILLILCTSEVFSQPVANFSATPLSGCSPLLVNFTDLSTGNPTHWKWDLGNGTISFVQNPSVSYISSGKYKITLIAGNDNGSDTIIKDNYITVQELPNVDFSANQTKGCYPLNIQFSDKSNTSGGSITNWQWDFGDGNVDFSKNPQHRYTSPGFYSVTLTIKNVSGCENTFSRQQYIEIQEGAIADFTNDAQAFCAPPVTLTFENLSAGLGVLSYRWNFGDGATSTAKDPDHVFSKSGDFTVRLLVTTSNGCIDTAESLINIGTVKAQFSAPDSICRYQPFTFINTSTPPVSRTRWNFGDGTTSNLLNPTKVYKNPGTYTVKMVADFGGCFDSISKKIFVQPKYKFDFAADTQKNCMAPLTVNFKSEIGDASIYKWDFGDGATSTAADPTHIYNDLGSFDVSLIVMSSSGCLDTVRKRGFIKLRQPVLKILDLPAEGCIPFSFTFLSEIDSGLAIKNYLWKFGDGTTSTLANPSHTFSEVGRYTISLSVITSGGCSKTTTKVKGVSAGIKPKADFSADQGDVCANVGINFSDLSTGNVNGWLWKFGDGNTSTEQNPTYIYQDTGVFSVTLVANSTGCADEITFENYIHIKPPFSKFGVEYECAEPRTRLFTDTSIGVDTWFWNFGDGTTSTLQNPPAHIYPDTGVYILSLVVKNLSNGCEFAKTYDIPVITQKANFIVNNTSVCKGTETTFYTRDIYDPYISKYEWDFGDGDTDTTNNDTLIHKYLNAGIYNIRLIITDILGCKDTLERLNYLKVQGPAVFFKASSAGGCLNENTLFIDSSESDGTHPLQEWMWDYGDGTVTTYNAPPFQHSYTAPGVYTISLKVLDSNGCADSLLKEDYLEISQPVAKFSTTDTASCPLRTVKFINLSIGRKLTSLWNFGDGTTSVVRNPLHQFSSDGVYNISLVITDEYGCTDSIEKRDYVVITSPKADFVTTDTLSPCSPFFATFTNTSINYRTLIWNFGDGNLSTVSNPSHVYSYPGVYHVTLKATGPGGCSDEKAATVIVKGPQGVFNYANSPGCDSVKKIFVASAKNSNSFIWDFNDGTTLTNTDSIVSHTYTNPGFYIPKLILISDNCQVPLVGQDTIWVFKVTSHYKSSNRTICDSGFVSFTDSSYSNDLITEYMWEFGDGTTSTVKNPTHFYAVPGIYDLQLKVTTNAGCDDTKQSVSPVKVVASPQFAINGDSGACTPALLTFNGDILVSDTSAVSWLWNFGNNNISTQQNPPAQIYSTAGFYTIRAIVTNSSGCSSIVSKTIEAYPIPLVVVTRDSFVCVGNSITLHVVGASAYTWSSPATLSCNNCVDPVATPANTTTYVVEGTSLRGCKAKDTVEILVKFPLSIVVSNNDSLCLGSSVRLNATGADSYLWIPATSLDDPTKSNPVASPVKSTNYIVVGTDDKKCFSDTGNISITVFALPTVNAGVDTTINAGQSAYLVPKISPDVADVKWTPANGIVGSNYPEVTVRPEASTEYTVLVTNSGTCMARDRVTVHVICNNANVFIPNTFSPDGNGINDIFYPRGSGLFTIMALRIFNKWGALIFQKTNLVPNDPKAGWDGTYKGKLLSSDVFIYQVDVVCSNGSILFYRGNVALIL